MKIFGIFILLLCVAWTADTAICAETPDADTGDMPIFTSDTPQKLKDVQQLLDRNKPKKAFKTVKKWIKKNPDSQAMDQALFLKGKAQFNRKLYYQAFEAYDELIKKYPASPLFAPTLRQEVEIARRFFDGEKRKVWGFLPARAYTEAIEILDRVIERWPGSELAAAALTMQADHYYSHKKYVDAQQTYQLITEDYPSYSVYQKALLRNAQSTYAQFTGIRYDTTCLADAQIRFLQYQARFPQHAEELNIPKILADIDRLQGEKELELADFYRRTHRLQAARYYWTRIIQRWPDSSFAQQAQQQLDKTAPDAFRTDQKDPS